MSSAIDAVRVGVAALRGDQPERYRGRFEDAFLDRVRGALAEGQRVLDIGSGRRPTVPTEDRPPGVTYVGLDISREELAAAAPTAYDEVHVADISEPVPEALRGRFDLAISFQVFEHVARVGAALEVVRSCLVPGGRFLTQLSGRRTPFAVVNRVLPDEAARRIVTTVLKRPPTTVFPAPYDGCYASALRADLAGWTHAEVVPYHRGAGYLGRVRPLKAGYIAYEEWLAATGRDDLAAYYIVDATA